MARDSLNEDGWRCKGWGVPEEWVANALTVWEGTPQCKGCLDCSCCLNCEGEGSDPVDGDCPDCDGIGIIPREAVRS